MKPALIWTLCLTLVATACQRSPAFRRDQGTYRPEAPSYYNKGAGGPGKTPAQRIESMGQPKKRVLVLDFWNDTPVKAPEIGAFTADELRRGLFTTQRMILPTEAKSDRVTEDFVQGDNVKVAQLIREGRKQGVAVLVIGRISKIVFRQRGDEIGVFRQKQSMAAADVELKVFDVANGREVTAVGKSGESSANTMVALEQENLESPEYRQELTRLAIRNAVSQLVPDVIRSVEKMT